MDKISKIQILKGLDAKETENIEKSVKFVFQRSGIDAKIEVVNTIGNELNSDEYLLIVLDEISLNQLLNNSKSKAFFESANYSKQQIILILDDIKMTSLPDYLLYLTAFELCLPEVMDTEEYTNKEAVKKTSIIQVIFDIALYIKQTHNSNNDSLTIYIGPSDDSTTEEYQKITRELLHRNHNLIPKILNPSAKEIIENPTFLEEMLSKADLAIHFIGHQSIELYPQRVTPAMRVNELVAEYCKNTSDKNIRRIIYVPDENEQTAESTRIKIAQFKSNTKILERAELVQTPVEKLKNIVLAKIKESVENKHEVVKTNDIADDVYVIFAPGTEASVKSLIQKLETAKMKVSLSQVNLDQVALLNYHQSKLKTCKSVIIQNNGNYEWLSRKMSDIIKSPGWGRKMPFAYKAIVGKIEDKTFITKYIDDSFSVFESDNEIDLEKLKKSMHA